MKRHITIGMDLGDESLIIVVKDESGEEIECRKVRNTKSSLKRFYQGYSGATVALEAGTHSPWISRLLEEIGCRVFVGNPRKLRLIWDSRDKSDQRDARILAMVCRVEPKLLWPIVHRSAQAHDDLEIIKSRDILVQSRTKLINHVRCVVKTRGDRLSKCSTASFSKRAVLEIPKALAASLNPLIADIDELRIKIKETDRRIQVLCRERYPETQRLQLVSGVGYVTAFAYVLTTEDPNRFSKKPSSRCLFRLNAEAGSVRCHG